MLSEATLQTWNETKEDNQERKKAACAAGKSTR